MRNSTKILAASDKELMIISACLQDALISLKDASFDAKNKKFSFLATRYQWEKSDSKKGLRTHTAVAFENIDKVETANLNLPQKVSHNLSLLNISVEKEYLILTFSENVKIRLKTSQLKVKLRDEGAPWPAKVPSHL